MAVAATVGAVALGFSGAARAAEFEATFKVLNANTSKDPCPPDGKEYLLSGRVALPASVVSAGHGDQVTLYLNHAVLSARSTWTFDAVPGYNLIREMAQRGHPSVTFDLPGWGRSPYPNGFDVCVGSEADMAHQVVGQLRQGAYAVRGLARAPSFARVVIAGLSSSALIAQVEAYSFADVNGLIVMAWAELTDPGVVNPEAAMAVTAQKCLQRGEPKNAPDGPPGYAYTFFDGDPDQTAGLFFHNADPRVVGDAKSRIERDPCGDRLSEHALVVDQLLLPTITAPVLLVYGERDRIINWPAAEGQRRHFTSAADVKVTCLKDTGHIIMLHPTRDVLYGELAGWLTSPAAFQPNRACTPPPS